MTDISPISALGRRIMVLGLTNSGKSTLTVAMAAKLDVPAIHLDQLRHKPHTNWEERTDAEFAALHDEAILGEAWVIDGSYSKVMPQRLARATGMILLTDSLFTRYRRYFTRTLFQKTRAGGLEGGQDHLNWKMIHWLWHTRESVGKYQQVAQQSGLPHVFVEDRRALNRLYAEWDLTRPAA
jgi:adenylate kinase family enzyme